MSDRSEVVPLGLKPSFGFGDRIGLATPGHVAAMKKAGGDIQPIFPQQSIREMTRTRRTPEQVMREALEGMASAGWDGATGADADHLKTPEDVDRTHAAGFVFFTIDPSDHVDEKADSYDETELRAKFEIVREDIDWYGAYLGQQVELPNGTTVELDEPACRRCAVKYGRAIKAAVNLADYIAGINAKAGTDYEIELSVDETEQPTTLAEHYIIASLCIERGMKLVSLAPRFVGDFEKGVDYIGDPEKLEACLIGHAAVAQLVGPYKLSLHSGSDKLSMYTMLARATEGCFHVKTAGTSYLEALRVAAIHDTDLFRRIIEFARHRYDTDKATYHVHATVGGCPAPDPLADPTQWEKTYLECWEEVPEGEGFTEAGRQILHCTFGSVLTDDELGPAVRGVLEAHPDTYAEVLEIHFAKHLKALRAGM